MNAKTHARYASAVLFAFAAAAAAWVFHARGNTPGEVIATAAVCAAVGYVLFRD